MAPAFVIHITAYPTLARLREFTKKRVWPYRRGPVATHCHHSILLSWIICNSFFYVLVFICNLTTGVYYIAYAIIFLYSALSI